MEIPKDCLECQYYDADYGGCPTGTCDDCEHLEIPKLPKREWTQTFKKRDGAQEMEELKDLLKKLLVNKAKEIADGNSEYNFKFDCGYIAALSSVIAFMEGENK